MLSQTPMLNEAALCNIGQHRIIEAVFPVLELLF